MEERVRAIDLFCGAGGSSWGAREAGVDIVAGFDLWGLAQQVFQDNFPEAIVYGCRLERIIPSEFISTLGEIDLILASPECTSHSYARGNKPRSEKSVRTAYQIIKFARVFAPRWIVIENVLSMRKWHEYENFLNRLRVLGYQVSEQKLNANRFGVPQSRNRLYILCDKNNDPKKVEPLKDTKRKMAISAVDFNGKYSYSPLNHPRRALATLERARRANEALGPNHPYLLVYYGSDGAGGWQSLDAPLRTVTTVDRFALVKPGKDGYMMRMLQVPELKLAMGFPDEFKIQHGTRRDKIHLLGNAVCPPVMEAIVRTLTKENIY